MNAPHRIDLDRAIRVRPSARRRDPAASLGADLALGALAGAAAVFVLDRVDWAMFLSEKPETRAQTKAVRPGGEPPAHVAATKLEQAAGVDLTPSQHDLAGNLVHYAIGVLPAALYGAARRYAPWLGTGRGGLFGLGLYLLQDQGLNTVSGLSAKPQAYPWQDHARGLAAHLAYGAALDLFLRALSPRRPPRGRGLRPA